MPVSRQCASIRICVHLEEKRWRDVLYTLPDDCSRLGVHIA